MIEREESNSEKGAIIFTHLRGEGSCNIGRTLLDREFRIRTINASNTSLDDFDPLRPDLLVVMGGPVGVYQRDDYPFMKREIEILKARIEADMPTIGVCLGSQLIAKSLGAKVYPGPNGKEHGWHPLTVNDNGKDTVAELLDASKTNMFHWHGDTFDLPDGATLLASSENYQNQIYTYGENILGLQCHPEVNEDMLAEWFVRLCGDVTGDNPTVPLDQVRKETEDNIQTLKTQAKAFFNAWLDKRGL